MIPLLAPTNLTEAAAILDLLPNPVWSVDKDDQLEFVNASWIKFTGRTLDLERQTGWSSAIAPEDCARTLAAWSLAFASRTQFEVEYRTICANGSHVWIRDLGAPRHDADGNFVGYVGTFVDISERRQAEQAVSERAELMQLLANSVPVHIALFRANDFRCIFANRRYAESYGQTELSIIGKTVHEVVGDEAHQLIAPHIASVVRGETVCYERPLTLPDGSQRIIEVNLLPHRDGAGRVMAAFVLINDITKHRMAEQAIRDSEERLRKFADATCEAILFHENGVITDCNEAAAQLSGLEPTDIIGKNVLSFVAPESLSLALTNLQSASERPYEITLVRKDGSQFAAELVGKTIVYKGQPHRLSVVRDISDRKEAEARIQFLAHHDTLTLLPNRHMLMERLVQILATAVRHRTQAAILFIDLDSFKSVNDSLGHQMGDALLKRVASRIQNLVRGADVVGRLGGDEFLVVLTDLASDDAAAQVAQKIAEAIAEPFSLENQLLNISGSIGISVFPRDGDNADTLIRNADAAMYLAKENGRNNYQFFTTKLYQSAFAKFSMESGIRKAIKQLEFTLHYQPEVDVVTGKLIGAEALIRWKHPDLGLLGPDHFISIAEHRGLIMPIGKWVMEEACRQVKAWQLAGLPKFPLAVNLSAIQFKQPNLASEIVRCLRENDLEGQYLELELTESVFMEDALLANKTLTDLKNVGVKLAIDDFGTGYSSLSYLKRYPIDKLKIDRSFVRDIPDDADDVVITTAIINLAHSLRIRVLAEGVENVRQVEFLARQRCDEMQGYYIAKPMTADDFFAWCQARG